MLASLAPSWRALRRDIHTVYRDDSAVAARIRYEHLQAVVRLTPFAMLANIASAALVLWAFKDALSTSLLAWFFGMVAVTGPAWIAWWRGRKSTLRTASRSSVHRATVHALLLAMAWGILPLGWLGHASAGQQLLLSTLFAGLLGAGAFLLSPLPRASLTYVVMMVIYALGGLARISDREPMAPTIAVLLTLYAIIVMLGALMHWRKAIDALIAHNEATRNEHMLTVVLKDFEQSASDALWEINTDGWLQQPSPRLAGLLCTSTVQLQSQPLPRWLMQHASQGVGEVLSALQLGVPFQGIQLCVLAGEDDAYLKITGKPLFDDWGRNIGWRGVITDCTAFIHAQAQLERLASTDPLTHLANRRALHAVIEQQLTTRHAGCSLLLLDLDHFKAINDNLGHSVGDALLCSVARCLVQNAPPHSTVARLGGDEFAVLWVPANHDHPSALDVAQQLIAELTRPHISGTHRLRINASIGVADMAADVTTVDEWLVRADLALYAAKTQGRGCAVVYSNPLRESTQRRTAIESGLRSAVRKRELQLLWQPKLNLVTREITGAEALMRWQHPSWGETQPGEFIPIAEQSNLIDLLGIWVLREACEQALKSLPGLQISVNVSPRQLRDAHFVSIIRSVLSSTGFPPALLELEITESVFIEDAETAHERLRALHGLGVRIALDDFGTGYSSLSYLCRFPFDTLKLDRSFAEEAAMRDEARAVVHMIAQLAKNLGMKTVCEGIETRAQLTMAREARIDEGQGYLLSRPMTLAQLAQFITAWESNDSPDSYLATGMAPLLPGL